MKVEASGLVVDTPSGWEVEIYRRADDGFALLTGEQTNAVVHLANFPLPGARGDFGSGAVEIMRPGDALVVLFEYGGDSVSTRLFSQKSRPVVKASDFDPNKMQRPLPGQSGAQYFFQESNRAFCLYVALGSHARRNETIPLVNEAIGRISIT